MKQKHQVVAINGHSGTGKTTLARSLIDSSFLEIDISDISKIDEILLDTENYSLDVLNRGKPEILFDRLRYADPRVIRLDVRKNEELDYLVAIINDNGKETEVFPQRLSRTYRIFLSLIILIRNKKNLLLDNFDLAFIGRDFKKIIEMIIREIKLSKVRLVMTSTDIGIWQLFSLCLPKEMSKTFLVSSYDKNDNSFNHLELDYLKLAYTINLVYNKNMKRLLDLEGEDRPLRPADEKDY